MRIRDLCLLSLPLVNAGDVVREGESGDSAVSTVFENNSTNFCRMDKAETVGATCDVTFQEINEINQKIRPELVSFCLLYTSRCV